MNLNKNTSYLLIHLLNGNNTAKNSELMQGIDIRSIQLALLRLTELDLIERKGNNNPTYTVNYGKLIDFNILDKLLEDENRPVSIFNRELTDWLLKLPEDNLKSLVRNSFNEKNISIHSDLMSARELENLTIELSVANEYSKCLTKCSLNH